MTARKPNKPKAFVAEYDPEYLEPLRHRRKQEGEMNAVIQDIIVYLCYLVVVMWVAEGPRHINSFYLKVTITFLHCGALLEIKESKIFRETLKHKRCLFTNCSSCAGEPGDNSHTRRAALWPHRGRRALRPQGGPPHVDQCQCELITSAKIISLSFNILRPEKWSPIRT